MQNIFHHHQPAVFQILPSSLYPFRFWTRLTPLFILYFNQKSNLQRINFLHTPFNDSNIRINSNKSWSTRWIPSSISQYLLAYSIYSRNNTTFPSRLPSSIQLNLCTHTFCQCYPFLTCSFKYGKPLSEKMKLLSLLMCEELMVEYRQFMHDRVGHECIRSSSQLHAIRCWPQLYTIYWLGVKGYQRRSCDSLFGFAEDRICGAFTWSIIFLHATIKAYHLIYNTWFI